VSVSISDVNDRHAWLQQFPADTRQRAQRLLHALNELGCDDPEGWARSEVEENIPQLARYQFLHTLWPQMIDSWRDGITNIPAAQRAQRAGASRDDLTQLAQAVAYETVFAMLSHLADDDQATDSLPSWTLTETDPAGTPTGRSLDSLHEDLLALDPSGQEGRHLWS
jgi:hypothetical protein